MPLSLFVWCLAAGVEIVSKNIWIDEGEQSVEIMVSIG